MSKFFLCVDPGGSQTKIIYQLPKDEKPRYLLMPPEVEEIKAGLNLLVFVQRNGG